MILNFETDLVFDSWPVFELYNENDEFLFHIELIGNGFIGLNRTPIIDRWCFLNEEIYIIDNKNKISIIFELFNTKHLIFKGRYIETNVQCYLKYVLI